MIYCFLFKILIESSQLFLLNIIQLLSLNINDINIKIEYISLKNNENQTILMILTKNGYLEIIKYLFLMLNNDNNNKNKNEMKIFMVKFNHIWCNI